MSSAGGSPTSPASTATSAPPPAGKLHVDTAKIKAEENLDGKYLLRCSDPHLSAEDIALGYKQFLEVERGWRDMKQIIDLPSWVRTVRRMNISPPDTQSS
ncbi:hypothetical protein AB0O34_36360 [Sphaerisporangium sp. NPDC088356]|uniref:hypothetical protein n=1 Tax=Sphaerisporangium sp. NPDC088356 TaxID=3154871 RepID=UPI0034415D72